MKRLTLTLLSLLGSAALLMAQVNFDSQVISERKLSCEEISETASRLFVRYMSAHQNDSVQYLLNYWNRRCPSSEPAFRANLLYALISNKNLPEMLQDDALLAIFNYQNRFVKFTPQDLTNAAFMRQHHYVTPQDLFDQYTQHFTDSLLTHDTSLGEYERIWANFYAHPSDTIFIHAASPQWANTALGNIHRKAVNSITSSSLLFYSMGIGGYFPLSSLRALPAGATIDLGFGIRSRKMSTLLNFSFGPFSQPRTPLTYSHPKWGDFNADAVRRLTIGIDVQYHFNRPQFSNFYALAGIAFEQVYFVDAFLEGKETSLGVSSPRISIGTGYQLYLKNSFLDFNIRYNYASYALLRRTDLAGSYLTASVTWNVFKNKFPRNFLRRIKYIH